MYNNGSIEFIPYHNLKMMYEKILEVEKYSIQ